MAITVIHTVCSPSQKWRLSQLREKRENIQENRNSTKGSDDKILMFKQCSRAKLDLEKSYFDTTCHYRFGGLEHEETACIRRYLY